jgi:signal peptidase II
VHRAFLTLRSRGSWLLAGIAAVTIGLDQLTKALVRSRIEPTDRPVEVLPFLDLHHVHNSGVAFGLFSNQRALLLVGVALVSIALLAVLLWMGADRVTMAGAGAILGGAVGNMIDRIRLGHVTDFIDVPHWPAFNVADIAIVIGVGIVLVPQLRGTTPAEGAANGR